MVLVGGGGGGEGDGDGEKSENRAPSIFPRFSFCAIVDGVDSGWPDLS